MYTNEKDSVPENTIKRIRDILHLNQIMVQEKTWYGHGKDWFSVRLNVVGTDFGVNGKGISCEFALASAYGELMERLQNMTFIYVKSNPVFLDSKKKTKKEILQNIRFVNRENVKQSVLSWLLGGPKKLYDCVPFYHYNTGRVVELPHDEFWLHFTSNGLSGGNTLEEAIVQGLCECFERYVCTLLYSDTALVFPTIPLRQISYLRSYSMIRALKDLGYGVIVKDLSLGGRFPVVGCLFINPILSRYAFRIGSAPVLDTAVQRCITEVFQGRNLDEKFDDKYMKPMCSEIGFFDEDDETERIKELHAHVRCDAGQLPSRILYDSGKTYHDKIFLQNPTTNKELVSHLLNKVINKKWDLFIRDVSYLGFPSCKLYIPGMSEEFGCKKYRKMGREFMCSLKEIQIKKSKNKRKDLVSFLSFAEKNLDFFKSIFTRDPFDKVYFLLSAIAHSIGDYKKLYKYLCSYKECVESKYGDNYLRYLQCFIAFTKARMSRIDDDHVVAGLTALYGRTITKKVYQDICDEKSSLAKNHTFLEERRKKNVLDKLAKTMFSKIIDQSKLRTIFFQEG